MSSVTRTARIAVALHNRRMDRVIRLEWVHHVDPLTRDCGRALTEALQEIADDLTEAWHREYMRGTFRQRCIMLAPEDFA